MTALRRLFLLLVAAGVAGAWLRRRFETPAPELPPAPPEPLQLAPAPAAPATDDVAADVAEVVSSRLEMGPVTDEMNAIPLPLEEEMALADAVEPEPVPEDEPEAEDEPEPENDELTAEEAADEELAMVETAEPEVWRVEPDEDEADGDEGVDIVAVVDDLLEGPRERPARTSS